MDVKCESHVAPGVPCTKIMQFFGKRSTILFAKPNPGQVGITFCGDSALSVEGGSWESVAKDDGVLGWPRCSSCWK